MNNFHFNIEPLLDKFHSACVKLTLFYVMIVMVISISFSVVLYNISSKAIDKGLGKQSGVLQQVSMEKLPIVMQNLERLRIEQLQESNNRLKLNLVYFNLLILTLSSLASYFLAKKTLSPIEEAMDAQSRFTADASHELRTPLTAMKSEIEVALRDKKLGISEARELLRSNLEEIDKLESLSRALLKLAKSEHDDLNFDELNIVDILAEAYEKVEPIANKKEIEIILEKERENIVVNGDRQSLVELFVILLDNAVKYSPKKSKITVYIEEGRQNTVVKIKDEGEGIKASDLPFIFNRFYRADSSRSKEKISGYGLGLSIAKQIADLHQGEISVQSKIGEGSEFTIKL